MVVSKLKDRLRRTFVYDIYAWFKYKLYPIRLNRAGVIADRPRESAVSEELLDGKRVIVSLTSFPARVKLIERCLCSLMNQEFKPNKIILWLAESQFPNKENDIPKEVLALREYGLEIRWVEKDIRSYKKLVPALKEFPDDIIVTADDDLYYPKDWLKNLVEAYKKDKKSIHCYLVIRVMNKDNTICDEVEKVELFRDSTCYRNQILGVSGSLFPPHSLYRDVTKDEIFMELAPTNDDVWFWAMAVKHHTKIHYMASRFKIENLIYIEGSQESTPCLTNINMYGEKRIEGAREAINKKYNLIGQLQAETETN